MHMNFNRQLLLKACEAIFVAIILIISLTMFVKHEKSEIFSKMQDQGDMLMKSVKAMTEETSIIRAELSAMIKKVDDIEEHDMVMKVLINSKMLTADQIFTMADFIPERCRALGIKTKSFLALMKTESDYNPNCVFSGAKGICQVKDCTNLEAIGVTKDYRWNDPIKNTLACLLYLEYIKSLPEFKSADEMKIFRAYNRGPFHKDLQDSLALKYQRKIEYYRSQM